jgi:acyl-coenzyme A thioesterase PaaI-like protein
MVTLRNSTVEAAQTRLEATRAAHHRHCLLCGVQNELGLKLDFRVLAGGTVGCDFDCRATLQSYSETLHGGVTSSLLDAAMTNCLFSLGVVAVTAELTVRFVGPVKTERLVQVRATLESHEAPLYFLTAEMKQEGYIVARAKAKFWTISGKT